MSALTDKLARLRADLAAATPGPLKLHEAYSRAVVCASGRELAAFDGADTDIKTDEANARAHVGAVNAAPMLLDVVEAAAKRPWWRTYSDAFCDADGWACDGCSQTIAINYARRGDLHAKGCRYAPSDAALDRAEAEAGS